METKIKVCKVCGASFESIGSAAKSGKCTKCRSEYRKEWALKNKDRIKASSLQYQKDNAEYLKAYKKAYRAKHPEMARESLREWKKRNPDKVLADGRKQDQKRAKKIERKEYMKNRRLMEKFEISLETYKALAASQNYLCAICNKPEAHSDRSGNIRQLCVDHCHKTGKIRQLLCNRCNTILGRALDDADVLEACAKYIRKHSV